MKKKIFMSVSALAVVALAAFTGYNAQSSEPTTADLMLKENIEALAAGDEYFKVAVRTAGHCTISAGLKGKVVFLSGTVLKTDASGNITIDGQVSCSGVGDMYCRPVECFELYQVL